MVKLKLNTWVWIRVLFGVAYNYHASKVWNRKGRSKVYAGDSKLVTPKAHTREGGGGPIL